MLMLLFAFAYEISTRIYFLYATVTPFCIAYRFKLASDYLFNNRIIYYDKL